MYKLYHFPLCPFSRKVRIVMHEKKINFSLKEEKFWKARTAYTKLNHFGSVPTLVKEPKIILPQSSVIVDYLEHEYKEASLMPKNFHEMLKVKTDCLWFDEKFYNDVVKNILYEKVINPLKFNSEPDTDYLSLSRYNLPYHLDYINYLLTHSRWISSDEITISDITAASHISILDYLGEINWKSCPSLVKDWYCIIKSRSSFKKILEDRIPGFEPNNLYEKLDF